MRGTTAIAIVTTAWLVVPLPGVEPGLQRAAKLAVLAGVAAIASLRGRAGSGWLLAFVASAAVSALAGDEPLATSAPIVIGLGCLWLLAGAGTDGVDRAIAIACTGIVAIAWLELLGVDLPWSWNRRPESTLGNRNQVAEYLVVALPFLVVRGRRALVVAVIAVIVATHCRTAYLAGLVACGVALGSRRHVPRWLLAAGFAGLVIGSVPWPGVRFHASTADSLARLFTVDGSGEARLDQHRRGLAAIAHPRAALHGTGPGGWMRAAATHAHATGDHAPRHASAIAPNSEWLRTLVEQGILGCLILAGVAVTAWRATRRIPDCDRRAARLASLAAIAIVGALDPLLAHPEMIALLAAVLADERLPLPHPALVTTRVVAFAFAVAFALAGVRCASFVASTAGAPTWATRLWPRPALIERAAIGLARAHRCRDAERALARFVAARPYVWGARVAVARCYANTHAASDARRIWRAALAHEPHLRALVNRTKEN